MTLAARLAVLIERFVARFDQRLANVLEDLRARLPRIWLSGRLGASLRGCDRRGGPRHSSRLVPRAGAHGILSPLRREWHGVPYDAPDTARRWRPRPARKPTQRGRV